MGGDWIWGYLAARRRARRRHRREMATLEARLRAELGQHRQASEQPASPSTPATQPRRRVHLRRWIGCSVVLVLMLLVLAFLVYLVVFGVQHGYIYPAHHQG